jgi:predicted nucleic acid-binding protein
VIAYLDTSAVVPLLIEEAGSPACRQLWEAADVVVTCRLTFVEAAAALAKAERLGRLVSTTQRAALTGLERLWRQLNVLEVDMELVRVAADRAHRFALRGYDAMHCAAAETVAGARTVAASRDQALLSAWRRSGLETFDTATR